MAKDLRGASRTERQHKPRSKAAPTDANALRALELVALRGVDVLGVRHLLEGGKCWVGNVAESIAKIPMSDFGGEPVLFAEVTAGRFVLYVPPRARGRMHGGKDGLGRLVAGPTEIEVKDGDRAVVVLGAVQIRARVVAVETSGTMPASPSPDTWRWLGLMGALYVAALAICALLAPERVAMLERGGLQRALGVASGVIGRTSDGTR